MTARSIRNNNPGNIVVGDPWRGLATFAEMTPEQRAETRFCVFLAPKWGFRAMAINLMSYQDKWELHQAKGYDTRTIAGIITRWAPHIENNTEGYIKRVCADLGVDRDEQVDVQHYRVMRPLVQAIAEVESGGAFPWPDAVVDEGLKLAGIVRPIAPAVRDPAVLGSAGLTVAGIAAAATEVAGAIEAARPISDLAGTVAPWLGGFVALAVLGFVLWRLVLRRRELSAPQQGLGAVLARPAGGEIQR